MSWRSPAALAVTAFYLGFLVFGIYVDLEDIFGFAGTWTLVLAVHLGLGAVLNRWDAALLPFLGGRSPSRHRRTLTRLRGR
jgi:hypothetical protein